MQGVTNSIAFTLFIARTIILSFLTMHYSFFSDTVGPTNLLHPPPTPYFKIFQVFLIYLPKFQSFTIIQSYAPNVALHYIRP